MSISHVLNSLNSNNTLRWQLFDMGQRVRALPADEVEAFEEKLEPYSTPYLQHAWLALLTWLEGDVNQHSIVFLKLPLDEFNILDPNARDQFVKYWLSSLQNANDRPQDSQMLPHTFTPDSERMAVFHAKAQRLLGLPVSANHGVTLKYLAHPEQDASWQQLSVQGLADVTVNLDLEDGESILMQGFESLPEPVKRLVLRLLENESLSEALSQHLFTQAKQAPEAMLADWVRALSASDHSAKRLDFLQHCLLATKGFANVELWVSIASRCQRDLAGEFMADYLEALASESFEQNLFVPVVQDLMRQPILRAHVMAAFRNPKRSDQLSHKLGALMQTVH